MERLTKNKAIADMSMYELTHNSCYIGEDGAARYRDFETDVDARELTRKLMCKYGEWKGIEDYGLDSDNELVDDDIFDDTMIENLMYEPTEIQGLIALFYRNLYAMANLREKLKAYEDAEEQGLLLRLPCKVGDTVYFLWRCSDGTTIVHQAAVKEICMGTYMLKKSIKYKIEPKGNRGMIKLFYSSDWGYDIFTSKEEAEQALKQMGE